MLNAGSKRITIRDVAKKAGVSAQTVSRVLNQRPDVAPQTREKVLQAIADLNYRPSGIARSLRLKSTGTIGLIVPDSSNPFFAELGRAIEKTAFENGCSVILCNSDGDLERESFYIEALVSKQVDGLIIVGANRASRKNPILDGSLPVVVVDRDLNGERFDTVLADNLEGGKKGTSYLIALGHERIAFIAGPSGLPTSAARLRGYRRALEEHGIAFQKELVVSGDFRYQGSYRAMEKLLKLTPPPTAVFAANDMMAVGAIACIRDHYLRVPEDISVIGFDDIPLASFLNPKLTTIAQPRGEMGRMAVTMLMERLQDRNLPARRYVLPVTLVERESCSRRNQ
ncbi:MAG: LacI family transcriptional regulator [Caldiserica bacterium]|jgi:LacI family transcriptional regulator|nr:LacI family transcriptional regulator [Caldisericota bacterium]